MKAISTLSPLVNTGLELKADPAKAKEHLDAYKASKLVFNGKGLPLAHLPSPMTGAVSFALLLKPGQEAVIVVLSDEEARLLASVLSFGWQLNLQDDTRLPDGNGKKKSTYRIEPVQR